ncbi:hypothetical protein AB1484_27330 [Parafrankia sp. FMc6]|uniref:hypothetical protein n=1 Tax=Parafrankia soli TaxID=2599596 RepID=UPI0034D5D46D
MSAERLRDGDQALEDLFDRLDEAAADRTGWVDPGKRPVIVTDTIRWVVWVEADLTDDDVNGDSEITDGVEPHFADRTIKSPDRWDWSDVYDEPFGPVQAPAHGPEWVCPERMCTGYQPAGASWPRRHGPRCPQALAAVVL